MKISVGKLEDVEVTRMFQGKIPIQIRPGKVDVPMVKNLGWHDAIQFANELTEAARTARVLGELARGKG